MIRTLLIGTCRRTYTGDKHYFDIGSLQLLGVAWFHEFGFRRSRGGLLGRVLGGRERERGGREGGREEGTMKKTVTKKGSLNTNFNSEGFCKATVTRTIVALPPAVCPQGPR